MKTQQSIIRDIRELKDMMHQQSNTISTLMQMMDMKKQQIYNKPQTPLLAESSLLTEIKTLKRKIQQLESGPQQYQQPMPYYMPQYIPQPPPAMQFYNYYPMGPPEQKGDYEQLYNQLNRDRKYKLEFEKLNQQNKAQSHRSHRSYKQKSQRYTQRDTPRDIQIDQYNKPQRAYSVIDSNQQRTSIEANQQRTLTTTPQKRRRKQLRRKLKGVFWYVYMGFQWKRFLQREWQRRRNEFLSTLDKKLEYFEEELNYKDVFEEFVLAANKDDNLLQKNWLFTEEVLEERILVAYKVCSLLLQKLPILTSSISNDFKAFIRKISINNGYLMPKHPKFVTDRLKQRFNLTLGPLTAPQSKMIQMDYILNQCFLLRLIYINECYLIRWIEIPDFMDSIKLIVSIFHQMFLDSFMELPLSYQNLPHTKFVWKLNLNENQILTQVEESNAYYTPTSNCAILGLHNEYILQPFLKHQKFQNDYLMKKNNQNTLKELQYKLEDQKNTINSLMQMMQQQQPYRYQHNYYAPPTQAPYTSPPSQDLLEEIKSLKRQIQRLEDGPIQSQYHQQPQYQMPMFMPQYIPQPQPAMQFYNYYPQNQQPTYNQPPQRDKVYRKLLLQLMKRKQDESDSESDASSRPYTRQRRGPKKNAKQHHDHSHSHRQGHPNENQRDSKRNTSYSQQSQQSQLSRLSQPTNRQRSSKSTPHQKRVFTDQEKLLLRRKLAGAFWHVYMAFQWKKFLQREWKKQKAEFLSQADEKFDKFDEELNYKEVFVQFVLEANKQDKLLSKSWVFTEGFSNNKVEIALNICSILLNKLPIMTQDLSDEHREFIQQISKEQGYLLIGHPKFVTDRIQEGLNYKLQQVTEAQTKMIIMDYLYNQVFLLRFLLINDWYSQYQKIPSYKESIKILISILHYLFIDSFKDLQVYGQDITYNKSQVYYCDFAQQEYSKVIQVIDEQSPHFQPTASAAILGLYGEEDLKPVLEHEKYKPLLDQYKQYYDEQYKQIIE